MCKKMWRSYYAKSIIQAALHKQSDQVKIYYKNRLNASINIARLLLIFGLSFWSHDDCMFVPSCFIYLEVLTQFGWFVPSWILMKINNL